MSLNIPLRFINLIVLSLFFVYTINSFSDHLLYTRMKSVNQFSKNSMNILYSTKSLGFIDIYSLGDY